MSTIPSGRTTYKPFTGSLSETNALAFGHKGTKVSDMQKMLKASGFDPGPIDGLFGPRTERALKAYQAANGAAADGTMELSGFNQLQSSYAQRQPAAVNLSGGVDMPVQTSGAQGPGTASEMLRRALEQNGDRYVFGAEVRLNDANPDTFDCSELVQWAVAQAGGSIVDGSQAQRAATERISVAQAARTPGALLFNDGHVAISLGDGVHTIEAMGSRHGVRIGTIGNRFEDGGLVRGLQY